MTSSYSECILYLILFILITRVLWKMFHCSSNWRICVCNFLKEDETGRMHNVAKFQFP